VSLRWATLSWRLGVITVVVDAAGRLVRVRFGPPAPGDGIEDRAACAAPLGQLAGYLAGTRRVFDLAVAPRGTPFERRVWGELVRVPHGSVVTYGELARRLGRPGAARAAGGACARNPVPIVVPCHRVVAADGSLGGYAAGIAVKRALLELEGVPAGSLPGLTAARR